jgi:hypothetical protein
VLKQVKSLFFAFSRKGSVNRAFVLLFCLSLTLLFSAPSAFAITIICRADKTVRTLRSDKTPEGGCRAVYTKQGQDQVVGSSTRPNGCDSILAGIRKTLESNIWKCKEVKEAVVSTLPE